MPSCDLRTVFTNDPKHLPVAEFVHPDVFAELDDIGRKMGFRFVESGPLVRSSYHAEKTFL